MFKKYCQSKLLYVFTHLDIKLYIRYLNSKYIQRQFTKAYEEFARKMIDTFYRSSDG